MAKSRCPTLIRVLAQRMGVCLTLPYTRDPRAGAAKLWAFNPSLTQEEQPEEQPLLKGLRIVTVLLK